jgi:hypothetical protein
MYCRSVGVAPASAGVQRLPHALRGAELVERLVLDAEQAALFEVGRGDAPPTPEVDVGEVAEHVARSTRSVSVFAANSTSGSTA